MGVVSHLQTNDQIWAGYFDPAQTFQVALAIHCDLTSERCRGRLDWRSAFWAGRTAPLTDVLICPKALYHEVNKCSDFAADHAAFLMDDMDWHRWQFEFF